MASDLSNVKAEEATESVASPLLEKQDGPDDIKVEANKPNENDGDSEIKAEQSQLSRDERRRDTPTPEPEPKPENICGICKTNAPKYKCPRCFLPYCSVACNKIHRENHPPDPEPKPVKQEPEVPQSTTTAEPFDPSNPFRALETSEALKMLFKKYPNLPNQLLEIHAATLPPKEAPEKAIPASLMRGVNKRENWNHDMGIKNGKAALRKARKANGEAGEAIREYTELIIHIMGGANRKEDATAYLQRQTAEEDMKLIERLMAEEQRKR